MLECVLSAAAFESFAGEILVVVAQGRALTATPGVIGLDQEHVLVELAVPALGQRLQPRDPGQRCRVGRRRCGQIEEDQVGLRVALPVVVEEEEVPIATDRTAYRS